MSAKNPHKSYDTLSEAVNDLKKRGYSVNFNLKENCIECKEHNASLKPDEFQIDEFHRFEGNTDPGDENIVYAISAKHSSMKGILVNAFGVYADATSAQMVAKLQTH